MNPRGERGCMLRRYFVLGWVFGALFLFAYFVTMIVAFPIGFLFRSAEFTTARTITQIAANVAVVGFLVTGAIVAVAAALQPGGWGRKILYVIPAVLLGVALVGLILNLL